MSNCIESLRTPSQTYPQISFGGKIFRESRLIWMVANGGIPEGLFVCHSCDNPRCINLQHLFLGTPLDNMLDKISKGRDHYKSRSCCKHGHVFTLENTSLSKGYRRCLTCHNNHQQKYLAGKK